MRTVPLVLAADSRIYAISASSSQQAPNSTVPSGCMPEGAGVGALAWLGTFAQYGTVPEDSLVKIDDDLPLNRACLVGCGVTTGWGSAVQHRTGQRPATPSS